MLCQKGFETEQAEIEADRLVVEAKTEEKNTLLESIEELKEGIETKKGEVKKMENDLVGKRKALFGQTSTFSLDAIVPVRYFPSSETRQSIWYISYILCHVCSFDESSLSTRKATQKGSGNSR